RLRTGGAQTSPRRRSLAARRERSPRRLAPVPLSRGDVKLAAPPWLAGHRGSAGELLENTLASFARAVDDGADLIELDVQLTADDTLVVLHDPSFARVAGSSLVAESARAADLAAVRLHDGSAPALLDDVVRALPSGFPLNVELKRFAVERERL